MARPYLQAVDVLWRAGIDTAVLCPCVGEELVVLHGPAASLWVLLGAPHSLRDASWALAQVFDIPTERAAKEVGPVFWDLVDRGLLVAAEGS